MSRRKTTGGEPPPAESGASEPADYAFDAEDLASLSDTADPLVTRKALLGQLGGMMAAAAGRTRKLANHHSYSDPDFTTMLRGFELAGKWLGIAHAPGDPAEMLRISAEVKALLAGKGVEAKPKKSKRP